MPKLSNYRTRCEGKLDVDWGGIAIYTYSASCDPMEIKDDESLGYHCFRDMGRRSQ
jgi:hypothetical protein